MVGLANYMTLWSICVSGCMRYGGNWMVQTLGQTLTNWLLLMHGWPSRQVASQAKQYKGPSPFAA